MHGGQKLKFSIRKFYLLTQLTLTLPDDKLLCRVFFFINMWMNFSSFLFMWKDTCGWTDMAHEDMMKTASQHVYIFPQEFVCSLNVFKKFVAFPDLFIKKQWAPSLTRIRGLLYHSALDPVPVVRSWTWSWIFFVSGLNRYCRFTKKHAAGIWLRCDFVVDVVVCFLCFSASNIVVFGSDV